MTFALREGHTQKKLLLLIEQELQTLLSMHFSFFLVNQKIYPGLCVLVNKWNIKRLCLSV